MTTNAEWLRENPGLPVDAAIKAADEWWGAHKRDAAGATPAERMAAWLQAEHEDAAGPETTIITTLTVTHVLHGIAAEQAQQQGLDQWIADNARAAAWAGYREHVLATGQPDDVCVSAVQVFGIERDEEVGE